MIRFYFKLSLLGLLFLLMPVLILPVQIVFWGNTVIHCWFMRRFSRLGGWIAGFHVIFENVQGMEAVGPCLYVFNHQSMLDYFTFPQISPRKAAVIGKKSIGWIPIFGWYFLAAGNVLIDRGDRSSAFRTLEKVKHAILVKGVSIGIFPEGTRNRSDPTKLLPFKKGAFHLASHGGIPIVPIVASSMRVAYDSEARRFPGGPILVKVLPPVHPMGKNDEDIENLRRTVQNRMQEAIDEANRRVQAHGRS